MIRSLISRNLQTSRSRFLSSCATKYRVSADIYIIDQSSGNFAEKMANYNPWLLAAALGEEHRNNGSKPSFVAGTNSSRLTVGPEECNAGLKILLPSESRDRVLRRQVDPCSPSRGSPEKWGKNRQPPTLVVAEQSEGQALDEWAEVMWSPGGGKYAASQGGGGLSILGINNSLEGAIDIMEV